MTSALSLYLDALRFSAAFTVFLSHYGAPRISGSLFWRFADYGHTAVLVFFVLSGFVIASVTDTREHSLEDYALSRFARLYSVMIPAFILTALLDYFGNAIDPMLYGPEWNPVAAHPALAYALSAVFLGESWTLAVMPGFNVPFWSLNYEAWYYARSLPDKRARIGGAAGRAKNNPPSSRMAARGCGMAVASCTSCAIRCPDDSRRLGRVHRAGGDGWRASVLASSLSLAVAGILGI